MVLGVGAMGVMGSGALMVGLGALVIVAYWLLPSKVRQALNDKINSLS